MSLILHCGAEPMSREEINAIPTPAAMGSRHCPVPYGDFIDLAEDALRRVGLSVVEQQFGALVGGEKNRFFGLLEVQAPTQRHGEVFGLQVGMRASHDQSLARSFVVGTRVFVCDNLAFSGGISLSTKQTTNIGRRLPGMVYEAVQRMPGYFEVEDARFDRYQDVEIRPREGDAALVEIFRRGIISGSQLGRAIHEWTEPKHPEHAENGHNVWRLQQAVTEAWKPPVDDKTGLATRPGMLVAADKGPRLSGFLDEVADFRPWAA